MTILKKLAALLTLVPSYVSAFDAREDWIQQGFNTSLKEGVVRTIPSQQISPEETHTLPNELQHQILKDIKSYPFFLKILSILERTQPTTDTIELNDLPAKSLPSKITTFTQLLKLSLTKECLEEFPRSLKHLTLLKELNLAQNQISTLPDIIGQLKDLEILNLAENSLNELSVELYKLENLKKLNLGYNQLTQLSPEIVKLKNLRALNLAGNNLHEIPKEILELPHLAELHLENNHNLYIPPQIRVQLLNKVRFCYLPNRT